MSKLNGGRLTNIFASLLASVLAVTAVVCTFIRVNELNAGLSIQMLASSLSMPQSAAAAAVNPPSKPKTTDAPVNSTEQPVQAAANQLHQNPTMKLQTMKVNIRVISSL